jgi:putative glycosyltransferase (TIGR04372 family)
MILSSLIAWVRLQKRKGKLKAVFYAYQWWRSNVISPAKQWWKFNALVHLCNLAIAIRPEWVNVHFTLGKAHESRYHQLAAKRPIEVAKLLEFGSRAIGCYQKVVALRPDWLEVHERLWSILFVMGEVDEAAEILRQAVDSQDRHSKLHQLNELGLRFIPADRVIGNIGVLGILESYVKAAILGRQPLHKTILLLTSDTYVSNRCFLDYWRKYITIITDPKTIRQLAPLVPYLEDRLHWTLTYDGQAMFWPSVTAKLQKQWFQEDRAPLLEISSADFERGWACLEKLGMPRNGWFVCLHVRDSGFKDGTSSTDSYRNSDIETYLKSIKSIVEKGGWVIRMGDPSMKPLPEMDHVIDYAHSTLRSDWMDVFCCAECRFFVGTSSGLYLVASSFGVPYVQTNYLPLWTLFFSTQDLFIPKLCRSVSDGRVLKFSEQLSRPLSTSCVQSSYDLAGVEIDDNTADEINDVVLEMLMRLDGAIVYSEDDDRLQEKFNSLTKICGTLVGLQNEGINCRIGRNFVREHADLLI